MAAKRRRGLRWVATVKAVGALVHAQRDRKGMSVAALAKAAHTDGGSISRLENGQTTEISVGLFFDLCAALGLDPAATWRAASGGDVAPGDGAPPSRVRGTGS